MSKKLEAKWFVKIGAVGGANDIHEFWIEGHARAVYNTLREMHSKDEEIYLAIWKEWV